MTATPFTAEFGTTARSNPIAATIAAVDTAIASMKPERERLDTMKKLEA